MRVSITCCKDCNNRSVGCHGSCPQYIQEKAEVAEYKKQKSQDDALYKYTLKITTETSVYRKRY